MYVNMLCIYFVFVCHSLYDINVISFNLIVIILSILILIPSTILYEPFVRAVLSFSILVNACRCAVFVSHISQNATVKKIFVLARKKLFLVTASLTVLVNKLWKTPYRMNENKKVSQTYIIYIQHLKMNLPCCFSLDRIKKNSIATFFYLFLFGSW